MSAISGLVKIVSEGAVAAGVRRIEALTGSAARRYLSEQDSLLKAAAGALKVKPEELPVRLAGLSRKSGGSSEN